MQSQFFVEKKVLYYYISNDISCIFIINNADNTIQLNSFQSLLRELQMTVTHQNDSVLQYLPHINALLERAVSVCKAAETTTSAPTQPLEKQENIHPGQTKELQWHFKQTAKTPGRKKSGLVLRYRHKHTYKNQLPCLLYYTTVILF